MPCATRKSAGVATRTTAAVRKNSASSITRAGPEGTSVETSRWSRVDWKAIVRTASA